MTESELSRFTSRCSSQVQVPQPAASLLNLLRSQTAEFILTQRFPVNQFGKNHRQDGVAVVTCLADISATFGQPTFHSPQLIWIRDFVCLPLPVTQARSARRLL